MKSPDAPPRRKNRRRPNHARIALRLALAALFAQCALALLFSHHLWVRTVRVEGSQSVRPERIFERMGLPPRANIVRLPVRRIRRAVEKEPAVARAEVRRRLPHTVIVRVRERAPWAVVKAGGICYTVDDALVPFRKERVPEPGLPLVVLEVGAGGAPRLGKKIAAPGVAQVGACLRWAAGRDDFPLEQIRVDQTGKLCLNREGGAEVRLGSGIDLDKKLNALAILLSRRADLREGNVVYVNLYAFDAPAVLPCDASSSL